jgi:hypothetical protein
VQSLHCVHVNVVGLHHECSPHIPVPAAIQAGAHVLVDGAHAFGALPDLHVPSLGCDTYTANLHKWGCTPKGAAFLWATPEAQRGLRPLVTSHGYGLGFRGEFMWQVSTPSSRHVLHVHTQMLGI